MSEKKQTMDTLRAFDSFSGYIPHAMTRRQALAMAADGRFPPCVRAYTRAEPLWREGDIVGWIAVNYGPILPEYVERLERDGLTGSPFSHGKSL
jgi:hypothetical protein